MSRTRNAPPARALLVLACVTLVAMVSACTSDDQWSGPPGVPDRRTGVTMASELREVQDCDTLIDAARTRLELTVDSMWGDGSDADAELFTGPPTTTTGALRTGDSTASGESDAAAPMPSSPDGSADAAGNDEAASTADVVGTNNQEQGVDEGDLIKTDGSRIVSVVDGVLRVTSLDGSPAIDGALDLRARSATELFLRGDEALVIGTSYGPVAAREATVGLDQGSVGATDAGAASRIGPTPPTAESSVPESTTTTPAPPIAPDPPTDPEPPTDPGSTTTTLAALLPEPLPEPLPLPDPLPEPLPLPPAPFAVTTTLMRVSLADPASPTLLESVDLEGSLVASRLVDGRARIVVRSEPLAMGDIMYSNDRAEAIGAVAELDAAALMPRVSVDGTISELGTCADVWLASAEASGSTDPASSAPFAAPMSMSTLTVVTVGSSFADLQPVSVQGSADTVYASTDSLVVGSQVWDGNGSRTDLHRFSLTGDGGATYTGSGTAPGRLLNQYSLSERDGALRVVTTIDPTWSALEGDAEEMPADDIVRSTVVERLPTQGTAGSGRLTVLDTDGMLDEIGHVDDLGVGEQVKSVRFLEDLGYVVTFRQTDPLFALDLSDPRNPTVLGELKIPGFSEYLHPVGDGVLLGVGREVDPDTLEDLGLKISLFDTSDPAAMVEVDQIIVPNAWSPVGSDPKAFTWDPQRDHAVVPVDRTCSANQDCSYASRGTALVVAVRDGQLAQVGEFGHVGPYGEVAPLRSVIVGDDLWTVSTAGLGRTNADDPTSVELLTF